MSNRHQPRAVSPTPDFPRTVEEFLAELERRFPEPRPRPGAAHADLMFEAGQRNVVLVMKDAYAKSQR